MCDASGKTPTWRRIYSIHVAAVHQQPPDIQYDRFIGLRQPCEHTVVL